MTHVKQFLAGCSQRDLRVTILYLPNFHFIGLGRPQLPPDLALMQALSGTNPRGFASVVYPGDGSTRWNRMGGRTPDILQFGSRGCISGFKGRVDVDAFRGTRDQLAASGMFTPTKQPKNPTGTMAAFVTVGPGDSIESIAKANRLAVAELGRLNRKDLQAGQRIRIK
jgi:hypothetical protein